MQNFEYKKITSMIQIEKVRYTVHHLFHPGPIVSSWFPEILNENELNIQFDWKVIFNLRILC